MALWFCGIEEWRCGALLLYWFVVRMWHRAVVLMCGTVGYHGA